MIWASLKGDIAHLVHVRTADAILHRPSHRWPEFQRETPGHGARKFFLPAPFPASCEAARGQHIFRNDHSLSEEVIRELNVERKIENGSRRVRRRCSSCATSGSPLSTAIKLALTDLVAGVDRRILRQSQVDQQALDGPTTGRIVAEPVVGRGTTRRNRPA